MPRTKVQAIKKAKAFLKKFPDRDILILERTNLPRGDDFKYNFRFQKKKGIKNKIIFKKERL